MAIRPLLIATLCTVALAAAASAHGPTVNVSYGQVVPEMLTIRVGDTVHFHNANLGGGDCTLVSESLEVPVLAPGKGWHHTFTEPGEHAFHLKERVSRKGVVRVVPADR